MSSSSTLQPVVEHGWRNGLANLLRKENSLWWGTRKWLVQSLIWLFFSNGILAFLLWIIPLIDPSANNDLSASNIHELVKVFLQLELFFTTFGVIVLAQGLIVNDKKFGTAAWVLSNPVSRSSFITSKLISHGWAIFLILVLMQNLVMYVQLVLKSHSFYNPVPIVLAIGVMSLYLLFYLTLALMLGTLFDSTGSVIGIPIALLIGMSILPQILGNLLPWLVLILPSRLTDLTMAVGVGQSLPSSWHYPLVSTGILIVLFITLAIGRFSREEF
ncbi:MAG: ABC transporter permease subunit [Anaerolineales bacterium]|nr:ABC transporter permease subunit [Anaerolineales bacterium]